MTSTQGNVTVVMSWPASDVYHANPKLLDSLLKGYVTIPGVLGVYAGEQVEEGDNSQKLVWLFTG
jgi:hypothetical protein